jgi:heme/copper-type cytochrome/quinol oxidase subunit 2
MQLDSILSTMILFAFLVTILLAVGSYAAYKLRERRRPRDPQGEMNDEPVFFERFFPATRPVDAEDVSRDARAS